MDAVFIIVALLIGVSIGYLIANCKLHKQTSGTLMFDRAAPQNAPYLMFESYEELEQIRKKKYATLNVSWGDSNSRR